MDLVMDWEALRDEFPITRNYNFQNHAAVAPLCRRAADAVRHYLTHAEENAYIHGGFYKHAERVRGLLSGLINAKPDEVTFVAAGSIDEDAKQVVDERSWE